MAIINERYWKKAYMLEFLENGISQEVFTFSVPPENEELDFPQRISETKTFGGVVFDDYGNDTLHITLSGSTVNEEKKYIYRGKQQALYLTGEKEIFYLQKLLEKWGDFSKIPTKAVYLYDLSKSSALTTLTGVATKSYWRVYIKDLKIKRSKDKPFTYNYTLDMFAVNTNHNKFPAKFDEFAELAEKVQAGVEKVQNILNKVEYVADVADTILIKAMEIKNKVKSKKSLEKIAVSADSPLRLLTGETNNQIYNITKDLQHFAGIFSDVAQGFKNDYKLSKTYKGEKHTVTFETNGGSTVLPETVIFLNEVEKPADPEKKYHVFKGWFTDEECTQLYNFDSEVTADFTLYAKWERITVVVTFEPVNGRESFYREISLGDCVEIPVSPERKNYIFQGWYLEKSAENAFNFETPITEDLKLYAGWKLGYVVDFDSCGGSPVETQTIYKNKLVIYPLTPTRRNHQFAGWHTDSDCTKLFNFAHKVTDSMTLFAKWVQFANNVHFESYGGSDVAPQYINFGEMITKPENPTKTGFTFVFWCDDKNASNEFNFETPVYEACTLYARWSQNIYTVQFESNGGSSVPKAELHYGDLVIFPERPEKEGFVFDKWCTDEELTEEFNFDEPITGNRVLYAKWFGV